jgi:hypothetical protein
MGGVVVGVVDRCLINCGQYPSSGLFCGDTGL